MSLEALLPKRSAYHTFPATESQRHPEKHSDNSAVIRDTIIGFADGLTVPFALTAGLSS